MGEEKLKENKIQMILFDYSYNLSGLTFVFSDSSWAPQSGEYWAVPSKH
jgi:hypothetical protein